MTERKLLNIFGTKIKLHRNRLKWSQAELAEKMNISINFLSDIETGKKWASPTKIVKFADLFNTEPYELLKPSELIPDDFTNVIMKFTEDIHTAVEKIRTIYLENEKTK